MESEEQKFRAQSARKQLRCLAREIRAVEEIVASQDGSTPRGAMEGTFVARGAGQDGSTPRGAMEGTFFARGASQDGSTPRGAMEGTFAARGASQDGSVPRGDEVCPEREAERALRSVRKVRTQSEPQDEAQGPACTARAAFARVLVLFDWLRSGGSYRAPMPRWEGALTGILRMFNDGTKEQAILAALNTLWYDIAERAELPMGEEHFLVRCRDHSLPSGRTFPCACILDNIRSAFNCGAVMRSAEGFGAEAMYLTGITPGPENAKVLKTAMGVIDNLNIQKCQSLHTLIREKKEQGYAIYALETAEGARPLFTEALRFPACVILGNEEYGLDGDTLACVDQVLEIPMSGRKNSFNVAASGSIFLYEARRQWEARNA